VTPFLPAFSRRALGLALIVQAAQGGMARVPAGTYVPLYGTEPGSSVSVAAFRLDRTPVSRRAYLSFVSANAGWQRGRVRAVFADAAYLSDWPAPLDAGGADALGRPVTTVSWFAARAFCEAQGKRLPTIDEWEYAAAASEQKRDATRDRAFRRRILDIYSARSANPNPDPKAGFRNVYGIEQMHSAVWEWTEDFNSILVSDDSRQAGGTSRHTDFRAVCAAGAIGASDPENYPAFMRYAFRAALNGRSSVRSLGFRCAANA